MNQNKHVSLYTWFYDYVRSFYSADMYTQKNIILKEQHTERVCQNIIKIGKALELDEEQLRLAEIIALFHDIGRFEQFTQYQTFRDGISVDHAVLGLRILDQHHVLDSLPEKDQSTIKNAIRYHNQCDLPSFQEEDMLMYARLIRDADKLDALDIIVNHIEERHGGKNTTLENHPDLPTYSQEFVQGILRNHNLRYDEIQTFNDMKLLYLAWIFDVNYPYTLKEMIKKDHIKRILCLLPDDEEINKVRRHIDEYVDKKLC